MIRIRIRTIKEITILNTVTTLNMNTHIEEIRLIIYQQIFYKSFEEFWEITMSLD